MTNLCYKWGKTVLAKEIGLLAFWKNIENALPHHKMKTPKWW